MQGIRAAASLQVRGEEMGIMSSISASLGRHLHIGVGIGSSLGTISHYAGVLLVVTLSGRVQASPAYVVVRRTNQSSHVPWIPTEHF